MFETMTRWIERHGCVVRFGNIDGAFAVRTYVYEFPCEEIATDFEQHVRQIDRDGSPLAVDDRWFPYSKVKERLSDSQS